eukprot:14912739-Heterocapsa_arctica.AAC.1
MCALAAGRCRFVACLNTWTPVACVKGVGGALLLPGWAPAPASRRIGHLPRHSMMGGASCISGML